jgi:hypothetical protein
MKFMSKLVLFLLVGLLLSSGPSAEACSCLVPGPPSEAFESASAVFVGTVKGVTRTDSNFGERIFRLSIEEAFKGVSGAEVEIRTPANSAACGYDFEKGQQYVVYAHIRSSDDRLVTTICTRTRPVSNAKEDLEYLRSLGKGKKDKEPSAR